MEKILCKKNWYLDNKLGYKEGKYYTVLKKDKIKFTNGILLKTDQEIKHFKGWFWSGSDYFDVDSLF